jgi:hypothetical protein
MRKPEANLARRSGKDGRRSTLRMTNSDIARLQEKMRQVLGKNRAALGHVVLGTALATLLCCTTPAGVLMGIPMGIVLVGLGLAFRKDHRRRLERLQRDLESRQKEIVRGKVRPEDDPHRLQFAGCGVKVNVNGKHLVLDQAIHAKVQEAGEVEVHLAPNSKTVLQVDSCS